MQSRCCAIQSTATPHAWCSSQFGEHLCNWFVAGTTRGGSHNSARERLTDTAVTHCCGYSACEAHRCRVESYKLLRATLITLRRVPALRLRLENAGSHVRGD